MDMELDPTISKLSKQKIPHGNPLAPLLEENIDRCIIYDYFGRNDSLTLELNKKSTDICKKNIVKHFGFAHFGLTDVTKPTKWWC